MKLINVAAVLALTMAVGCGGSKGTQHETGLAGCPDGKCDTQACPDPNDPTVHYIQNTNVDPSLCWAIRFGCADNQTLFSNECGCGCVDNKPAACPDPNDPTVHYIQNTNVDPSLCWAIRFGCADNQTLFSNECGCGCVDNKPAACPDPNDPAVHYIENTNVDPSVCRAIRFGCADNQTLFSNECGCGCIDTVPACPDVCAALCAGQPQPEIPAGCPVPMCQCPPIAQP